MCVRHDVRALLFTSEEPLYLPRYLEPIVAAHAGSLDAVVIAPPPRPRREQLRRQFRALGPSAFLRLGRRFAAGRLLDRLDAAGGLGRRVTGRFHSVRRLARTHDVPVWHAPDVNAPGFVDRVRAADPDLLLSIVAGQKLGADLLAVPAHAVNLHGSLLPQYRGRAVAFWPLFYGDDETGVTAHLMTSQWDAGPIVGQRSVGIHEDDTVHDLYLRLADAGSDLACDLLERYPADLETRPNDTGYDDYHTLPTPAERRAFLRRGNRFV